MKQNSDEIDKNIDKVKIVGYKRLCKMLGLQRDKRGNIMIVINNSCVGMRRNTIGIR